MEIRKIAKDDQIVLVPSGEMTIYHVNELKDAFISAIREFAKIAINLEEVQEFDSAGFQVLYLAKREATRQNKVFKLINHSTAVLRIFDLYGAVGLFGDKIKVSDSAQRFAYAYGTNRQKIIL